MAQTYDHLDYGDTRCTRLRRIARLMDSVITIPGTKFRFGFDAILDLIPGIGDVAGKAVAAYIIYEAAQMNVPSRLLWRMAGNVLIDFLVGAVPFLGAIFGAAWRANLMNVDLIEAHLSGKRT